MIERTMFNGTVCLIGALVLLLHIVSILFKKERRKDENSLLFFFIFTAFHFSLYFTFVIIKSNVKVNETFIMSFYTIFYIMNNIEVLLFYNYLLRYVNIEKKVRRVTNIINYSLFAIFVISDIVNIFTRMYFTALPSDVGAIYQRNDFMIISQGYQFVMLIVALILVLINKTLNIREKIAFSTYCFIPFIAIIFQNIFAGYAIAYAALLLAVEILFLFLNVERNIALQEDEKQLKEAEIKIMVSQIQPHFIYNTLSSISTLIPINPDKAQKALDDFTDYLRVNFSTLTETKLVSFEDELKHIQTYVALEKMRFNDRLKVKYDITVKQFFVPPLSIQPLVENAIKHGILKKIEGGTLTIKTREDDNSYIVEVIDDGVGFNIDGIDFKNNEHIGINNVKHRITTMGKGTISFTSEINKGTKVVVTFLK